MGATFYLLTPTTMHPLNLVQDDAAMADRTWRCAGCGSPRPDVGAVDVRVANRSMGVAPLNLLFGDDLGVARKDFLSQLGDELVSRDLHLGTVRDRNGKLLDGWATVRGKHRVVPRAARGVGWRHRVCERCGRHVYWGLRYAYLCPAPTPGVDIFTCGPELVVTPRVYGRIRGQPWRRLGADTLTLTDAPPDGLGPLTQP